MCTFEPGALETIESQQPGFELLYETLKYEKYVFWEFLATKITVVIEIQGTKINNFMVYTNNTLSYTSRPLTEKCYIAINAYTYRAICSYTV